MVLNFPAMTVSVAGAVSNAVTVPVVSAGPGLLVSEGTSAIVQNAADYTLERSQPSGRAGQLHHRVPHRLRTGESGGD